MFSASSFGSCTSTIFKFRDERLDGFCILCFEIEPRFEKLKKDPLCPFVILRIGGIHFTAPVVAKANVVELFFVSSDVFCGGIRRMAPCLNGVLFGWQSKSIKSHWMQNVEALQSFVTRNDVGGNISERMPNV